MNRTNIHAHRCEDKRERESERGIFLNQMKDEGKFLPLSYSHSLAVRKMQRKTSQGSENKRQRQRSNSRL